MGFKGFNAEIRMPLLIIRIRIEKRLKLNIVFNVYILYVESVRLQSKSDVELSVCKCKRFFLVDDVRLIDPQEGCIESVL